MHEAPYSPSLAADGKDTPDYRKTYLRSMQDWKDQTKEQAFLSYKNSPEYSNVEKYIRYLEGNQWDNRRPKYKSRYVENKLELTRRERLAILTDSKPICDVSAAVDAYDDTALTINRVIISDWYRQQSADTIVELTDIAMLHGIAFAREGASSPGLSTTLALGPDNVMPIQPSLRSLQDSAAVLYRNWKPISYFKKVFPMNSEGLERQARYTDAKANDSFARPSHIPEYTWSQMSPQFKRLVGVKAMPDVYSGSKLYGSIELEEYYYDDLSINESNRTIVMKDPFLPQSMHNWWYEVKPGQRLYPRKRLIIYAGDRLMYDGPSPFWHGMYPFIDLKLNPVPWSYYGLSSYRSLIPMQDAINEIPAGVLDMTKRALNPTIITKTNVASEAAWREYLSDMPGAKLKVNPQINIATDIQYGAIPQVPQYVGELYRNVILPEFDKMSGIIDIAAMGKKQQVPSGDTLDQMKDALQTPLRREERMLESFIQRVGQQKVSNIIQFYTAKQRLKMLGEDGLTWEDFLFDPGKLYPSEETSNSLNDERKQSFWKQFSITVKPGSLHSGSEDKSKMEAMALASRGLMPPQEVLRKFGYTDSDMRKFMEEMQQWQAISGQAGGPQAPQGPNGGGAGGSRSPRTADEKGGPQAPLA